MPCKGIKAANREVNEVVNSIKSVVEYICGSNGTSANIIQVAATQVLRGPYERFTPEEKA